MKSSRWLLYTFVVVLLVAGGVALFLSMFEMRREEVRLPPRGEAAYNPLYALQLSLRQLGIPVQSQAWLDLQALKPAPGDTLVLYSSPDLLPAEPSEALLQWVESGGHLVMPMAGSEEDRGALASALGLYPLEAEPDCTQLSSGDDDTPGLQLCRPRFLVEGETVAVGDGSRNRGYRFVRLARGRGLVSVMSELHFLDNRWLEQAQAQALAYTLLAPHLGRGRVLLVYDAEVPSLRKLLLQRGWMVLLPLALGLLAWLLWRSQRFGPLLPAAPQHRRALLEHVQAAGEFAWRRRRGADLHAAVRRQLEQRLRRRDPMLAALQGEALAIALAERVKMPLETVREALRPAVSHHPEAFQRSIACLIEMRSRL